MSARTSLEVLLAILSGTNNKEDRLGLAHLTPGKNAKHSVILMSLRLEFYRRTLLPSIRKFRSF